MNVTVGVRHRLSIQRQTLRPCACACACVRLYEPFYISIVSVSGRLSLGLLYKPGIIWEGDEYGGNDVE